MALKSGLWRHTKACAPPPSLVSEGQAGLLGAPELKLSLLCCPAGRSQVSREQRGEGARQMGDNRRSECFRTRSRAKLMEAALLRSGG